MSRPVAATDESWPYLPYEKAERNLYCGVDPGASGGIALLDPEGAIVDVTPMPETPADIAAYFEEFAPRIRMATIESVHSFPGQSANSMFKFGWNAGLLHMALIAMKIPFEFALPGKWQQPLGCIVVGRKGPNDHYADKKRFIKARIQELFPQQKVTLKTCDAIGIAEFCRRKSRGLL